MQATVRNCYQVIFFQISSQHMNFNAKKKKKKQNQFKILPYTVISSLHVKCSILLLRAWLRHLGVF